MAAAKGNKYALGNKGGAPPLYKTPEELQSKIDEYFNQDAVKITICGLALFLGFAERKSLLDYEKKEEFVNTIKRAKLRVEASYEEMLHRPACTGAIFALKNLGWVDKVENTHSINLTEPITGIKIIRDGAGV